MIDFKSRIFSSSVFKMLISIRLSYLDFLFKIRCNGEEGNFKMIKISY